MKDYITNTIILKNGDQVEIVEPASLPLNQKLMYQIENAEDKIIINYKGTKTPFYLIKISDSQHRVH